LKEAAERIQRIQDFAKHNVDVAIDEEQQRESLCRAIAEFNIKYQQ
jgi:hypothetical protein